MDEPTIQVDYESHFHPHAVESRINGAQLVVFDPVGEEAIFCGRSWPR